MLEPGLIQSAAAVGTAFAASLVECVEALTIVLALSSVSGWRSGLLGAACGGVSLAAIVALAGGALVHLPLDALYILVGVVLLAFGLSWLRKALLRTAGIKALHDEAAIYIKQVDEMRSNVRSRVGDGVDLVALTASFKAVVIEGVEVLLIVIAVGHTAAALVPAALGAVTAAIVVTALGIALHRPLTRVPENALKFGVGVVIVSFGIFWLGEGLGVAWPGGDLAVVAIIAGVFALAHSVAVRLRLQHRRIRHDAPDKPRASVADGSAHQV
jgi:uncharacterized membrane protein